MPNATALQSMSTLPEYRTLLLAVDGGVATITLNRPEQRNAVGDGMATSSRTPTGPVTATTASAPSC